VLESYVETLRTQQARGSGGVWPPFATHRPLGSPGGAKGTADGGRPERYTRWQGSAKSMADGDDDCRDTVNDTHTAKAKRNAKAKAKQTPTPVVDFAEAEEATEQDLEEQIAYQQSKSTRSGGKGSPMMPTGAFVRPDGVNEQGAGGAQPSRRRKQQHRKKEKKNNNKRNKYLQPKKKKKSATASGQEQEQEVAMGSVAKQAQQRRLEQERAEQRR